MLFRTNHSNLLLAFYICILQLFFVVYSSGNIAVQIECDAISNTDFGRRFCFIRHLNQRILPNITYKPNPIADEKRELIFDNCTLNTLPLSLFEHFPHIKTVYAWNIQLKFLSTELFRNANELLTLDLSKNHIERLESHTFSLAVHLTQLDLSKNHIESIDVNAFTKLNQLNILNLNYNKLSIIPAMAFIPMAQLKAIHLSFNSIKMIPVELFAQNLHLNTIHLNDNAIEWLFGEQTFRHLSNVNEFDLHNNPIVNFAGCIINAQSIDIRNTNAMACFIGPRTKRMLASNNRIEYVDITAAGGANTTTKPSVQLEHIDLANNRLHSIRNLTHFERLRYLDLTNNHLHDIGLNSFARMHQLEVLNLRNSGLAHIYFGMFSHKSRLRSLDLSHNELGRIDFRMFVAMTSLVQLHLDGNNLNQLDATEIRRIFPALIKIGISQNDWSCHNLASIIKHLESNSIALESIETTHNTENIKGIPCKNNDDVVDGGGGGGSGNGNGSGGNKVVVAVHDGNDARKTIAENEITTQLIEIESSQEIQTFTPNNNNVNVNVNEQQPHANQPSNGMDVMSLMVRLLELKYDVQNTIQNANEVGRKLDHILQIL